MGTDKFPLYHRAIQIKITPLGNIEWISIFTGHIIVGIDEVTKKIM